MNARTILALIIIVVCWGLGGFIAPAEAGTLKDAATFTEEKVLPVLDAKTAEMNAFVKKEAPPAFEKAKAFTESKVLPQAKIAGSVIADKSKKVWQVLIAD